MKKLKNPKRSKILKTISQIGITDPIEIEKKYKEILKNSKKTSKSENKANSLKSEFIKTLENLKNGKIQVIPEETAKSLGMKKFTKILIENYFKE